MIYQVPQFIEENVKLMGLITFVQLWIILFFIGLAFISFLIFPFWLAIIFAVVLLLSGALVAFGRVNGVPVYKLVLAAIRHFWLPKYYLWKKAKTSTHYFPSKEELPSMAGEVTKTKILPKKNLSPETLQKLTNLLDQ